MGFDFLAVFHRSQTFFRNILPILQNFTPSPRLPVPQSPSPPLSLSPRLPLPQFLNGKFSQLFIGIIKRDLI